MNSTNRFDQLRGARVVEDASGKPIELRHPGVPRERISTGALRCACRYYMSLATELQRHFKLSAEIAAAGLFGGKKFAALGKFPSQPLCDSNPASLSACLRHLSAK